MFINKAVLAICCAVLIGVGGCSRQQSDWQKTREANSTDAYEQFLKKYPTGEFTAQAQARLKEMYEERDWQKARDADTPEAYQAFLKQYPEGKWTEEARIRVENFTLAQTPAGAGAATGAAAGTGAGTGASAGTGAAAGTGATAGTGAAAGAGAAPPNDTAMPGAAPGSADETSESAAKPARPAPSRPGSARRTPPAAPAPADSGRYAVQLGAFKSGRAAATQRWEHLQKDYPKLLAGLSSKVLPRKTASGTLYRLQAVDLSEPRARRICKLLKEKSQPCVIVRPAHGHNASRA
jgi:cell division protein FtsN